MVKVIAGLMGGSVAAGSKTMSGPDQLRPVLALLKQHNVKELDTARVYNSGKSEEDLGAISSAQQDFSIATKAPGFSPKSLSFQNVLDNCHASLQALKQEKIDLYYFHGPDRQTPLEESCKAIHQLHQEGKIVKFGISNYSLQEVEEIHNICSKNGWVLPSVYQGMYNPLGRAPEEALYPALRKFDIAYYIYSPLAGGFFSRTTEQLRTPPEGSRMDQMKVFANMYVNDVSLDLHDRLGTICAKDGVSVKEATLRWLMHHSVLGEDDGVILGASSQQQMEENLKACEGGPLPEKVVQGFETMWTEWKSSGKALPASF